MFGPVTSLVVRRAASVTSQQLAVRGLSSVRTAHSSDMDIRFDGERIAVTGAAPCVFRASEMERAMGGSLSTDVELPAISPDGLNSDMHAAADYRAHLVGVMTKRAIAAAG